MIGTTSKFKPRRAVTHTQAARDLVEAGSAQPSSVPAK